MDLDKYQAREVIENEKRNMKIMSSVISKQNRRPLLHNQDHTLKMLVEEGRSAMGINKDLNEAGVSDKYIKKDPMNQTKGSVMGLNKNPLSGWETPNVLTNVSKQRLQSTDSMLDLIITNNSL